MSLLETVWADLKKIFAFAPVIAAVDPNAAGGITAVSAAVAALQPVVSAVSASNGNSLNHADLVIKVTDAIAKSSAALAAQGILSGTTDQHIQAAAPLIHAAVAVSGLASDAQAPAPV